MLFLSASLHKINLCHVAIRACKKKRKFSWRAINAGVNRDDDEMHCLYKVSLAYKPRMLVIGLQSSFFASSELKIIRLYFFLKHHATCSCGNGTAATGGITAGTHVGQSEAKNPIINRSAFFRYPSSAATPSICA